MPELRQPQAQKRTKFAVYSATPSAVLNRRTSQLSEPTVLQEKRVRVVSGKGGIARRKKLVQRATASHLSIGFRSQQRPSWTGRGELEPGILTKKSFIRKEETAY